MMLVEERNIVDHGRLLREPCRACLAAMQFQCRQRQSSRCYDYQIITASCGSRQFDLVLLFTLMLLCTPLSL